MTTTEQSVSNPPAQPAGGEPPRERPLGNPVAAFGKGLLDLFSSMKLTVVLLLLLGLLTLAGTLVQQHVGVFVAQRDFFESFFVVWDTGIPLLGDRTVQVPLLGGYALLLLLFANLMVGGVVRHRWHWRNGGILIAHLGIALLLVAGFVKLHFGYAGHVALYEGKTTATMVSFHDYELALLREDGGSIVERTVPASAFEGVAEGDHTVTITAPDLPFTVEVSHYAVNTQPRQKGPMVATRMPLVGDDSGQFFLEAVPPVEERERNLAGCYVTVTEKVGRKEHKAILHGVDARPFTEQRQPFTFTVDGVQWGLDLRRIIWELPFRVRLDKFEKSDHPGTMTPRDFSSWVTVFDGDTERQVHIYMNHPLRRSDHVFFQTSWGPQPGSRMTGPPWWSVFEVAKNPSDAWPKYASYVILLGLLIHFVIKLARFLDSSTRRAALPEMS